MTAPALTGDMDEASALEHLEMAGGRGPAVLEAFREISARQLAAQVAEEHHNVPARFVTERKEHGFDLGEVQRHPPKLARRLIVSNNANYQSGFECSLCESA